MYVSSLLERLASQEMTDIASYVNTDKTFWSKRNRYKREPIVQADTWKSFWQLGCDQNFRFRLFFYPLKFMVNKACFSEYSIFFVICVICVICVMRCNKYLKFRIFLIQPLLAKWLIFAYRHSYDLMAFFLILSGRHCTIYINSQAQPFGQKQHLTLFLKVSDTDGFSIFTV